VSLAVGWQEVFDAVWQGGLVREVAVLLADRTVS